MGPSRILTVVILIAIVTTVMLVIADTAFAQVQPTPTTMLKCFKELYDATWFFAFLARAYDELLHVNSSRRYLLISPCRDEERPRVQAFPPLLSARLPANGQAGRHGQGRSRARPPLACQSPRTLMRRR